MAASAQIFSDLEWHSPFGASQLPVLRFVRMAVKRFAGAKRSGHPSGNPAILRLRHPSFLPVYDIVLRGGSRTLGHARVHVKAVLPICMDVLICCGRDPISGPTVYKTSGSHSPSRRHSSPPTNKTPRYSNDPSLPSLYSHYTHRWCAVPYLSRNFTTLGRSHPLNFTSLVPSSFALSPRAMASYLRSLFGNSQNTTPVHGKAKTRSRSRTASTPAPSPFYVQTPPAGTMPSTSTSGTSLSKAHRAGSYNTPAMVSSPLRYPAYDSRHSHEDSRPPLYRTTSHKHPDTQGPCCFSYP